MSVCRPIRGKLANYLRTPVRATPCVDGFPAVETRPTISLATPASVTTFLVSINILVS